MGLYSVIADIEAGTTLKIHEVKSVDNIREYIEEYIDLYILVNSILIRYVTEKVKSNFERIKRITYIGEIEASKTPPIEHEHHEHEISSGEVRHNVLWFDETLESLQISEKEKTKYENAIKRNISRILEALNHAEELKSKITIILEEEYTKTPPRIIEAIVEANAAPQLNFTKEYHKEDTITQYIHKIGEINTK